VKPKSHLTTSIGLNKKAHPRLEAAYCATSRGDDSGFESHLFRRDGSVSQQTPYPETKTIAPRIQPEVAPRIAKHMQQLQCVRQQCRLKNFPKPARKIQPSEKNRPEKLKNRKIFRYFISIQSMTSGWF
jgi:hypothetical protein